MTLAVTRCRRCYVAYWYFLFLIDSRFLFCWSIPCNLMYRDRKTWIRDHDGNHFRETQWLRKQTPPTAGNGLWCITWYIGGQVLPSPPSGWKQIKRITNRNREWCGSRDIKSKLGNRQRRAPFSGEIFRHKDLVSSLPGQPVYMLRRFMRRLRDMQPRLTGRRCGYWRLWRLCNYTATLWILPSRLIMAGTL